MENDGPYRDQERTQVFVKMYSCDTPTEYVEKYEALVRFVNRILDRGIKRQDIKFFENSMIYYVKNRQYVRTFLTLIYYARIKIT